MIIINDLRERIITLPSKKILFLLLSTDFLFIVMHVLRSLPGIDPIPILEEPSFSISMDHGLGEGFQYVKEFWIALQFGALAHRQNLKAYFGWALLFGYLLFDDMLKIHEQLASLFTRFLSISAVMETIPRLRAQDIGELVYLTIIGVFFLLTLGLLYLQSDMEIRQVQKVLILLFIGLGAFGVGVDFLNRFSNSIVWISIIGLVEDGGEMLVMSIICWFTFTLHDKGSNSVTSVTNV